MGASSRQTRRAEARARTLSRVHWRLGQALLPEHFQRQEQAFRRELAMRFGLVAPAAWGVGLVEWDEVALARGTARVGKLMAIFPGGAIAHVPGNARASLLDLEAVGSNVVSVYAHLLAAAEPERDDALEAVELAVHRVELSAQPGHPGAVDSFRLAEIEKGPDGVWALRPGYAPPLLALDAWPSLFDATIGRLRAVLAQWQDLLAADVTTATLSIARQVRAHEALRRSHLLESFLAQLGGAADAGDGWPVHPFDVFRRLMDLYVDIHDYQTTAVTSPPLVSLIYDHHDIAAGLETLLGELEQRTRPPHGQVPYAPFVVAGRVAVCPLPPAAMDAPELYWLIDRGGEREPPRAIKLASRPRLDVVHRHALKGIGVRVLDRVPFRHDFAPDVAFYRVVTEGEEWDHARRDGSLACLADALGGARAYLFWRGG